MSKIDGIIQSFVLDKARLTARNNKYYVQNFLKFLKKPYDKATEAIAWQYLGHIKNKRGNKSRLDDSTDKSWTSIKCEINTLKNFYDHLIMLSLVKTNPFTKIYEIVRKKKSPAKSPSSSLPFDQVTRFSSLPLNGTKDGVRDSAILTIAFATGLRNNDIVSLKLCDVRQTDKGTIYLYIQKTKSQTNKLHALPEWAHEILKRIMQQRVSESAKSDDFLFVMYTGEARDVKSAKNFSSAQFIRMFRKYSIAAGLGRNYTPHCARATAITKALDDGMVHSQVREISGHASIQMVEYYYKKKVSIDESPCSKIKY